MRNWLYEKREDITGKIILFILSPTLSFFFSFIRVNTRSSYIVFFLTALFFGMSFTVDSGKASGESGLDGQFYRGTFEDYSYISYNEFRDYFLNYITFNTTQKDFFFETIAFVSSRVTDNYHFLFMVIAAIFAYFCLKSFRFLTQEPNFNTSITSYCLAYFFLFNQLFNINGLRFWIPAWIAVYCIFQIHINKNNKYYLLALTTPFFHGSYTIFIAMLLIGAMVKKLHKLWVVLFYISLPFSSLGLELVSNIISKFESYLPAFAVSMADSYVFSDKFIENSADVGLISNLFQYLVSLYIILLVILLIRDSKNLLNNAKTKDLYSFLLVWFTTFNFLSSVPSLGGRFQVISFPIIAYLWLVNFKGKKYDIMIILLPFIFILETYKFFVYYNVVLDPFFYVSNPVSLMYKYLVSF